MKGQSEIVSFVLLFVIGTSLFILAVVWSSEIVDQNIDIGQITASETFMERLGNKINSIIKFGGQDTIDFNSDGTIELIEGDPDTIEVRMNAKASVPDYWVYVSSPNSNFIIREMLEGGVFKIQLYFPERSGFKVDLFTEGPRLSTPQIVIIDKNETISDGGVTSVVKITFQ